MHHLQHGLVNKHMMTSIPEKGSFGKAWGCQNQEKLLIPGCKRCRQSANAKGIHSHSIIYSSESGCMQAVAHHSISHPGELSQRFLNMAKSWRTPVLRRVSLVKADAWTENAQQKEEPQFCPHTAPTDCSSPGHVMVYKQTSNEYLKRHGLEKGSVCGEW